MILSKVLIALVVISLGITGGLAVAPTTIVIGDTISNANGQINYYIATDGVTSQAPNYAYSGVGSTGALSAFITGASIRTATEIHTFMHAQTNFGDSAITGLDVVSNGATTDSSVTNYNMYGYLTGNLAYAGQYADRITGEQIDLRSQSFNKALLNPPLTPTGAATVTGFGPCLTPLKTSLSPLLLPLLPIVTVVNCQLQAHYYHKALPARRSKGRMPEPQTPQLFL